MSKLFTSQEPLTLKLSMEKFVEYYNTASVVSLEAISDYFYKLKDLFTTLSSSLIGLNNDKIVTDALATRFETLYVLKRIKFVELRDEIVLKPENFKGKYIDYSADLIESASVLVRNTEENLHNLKMAVSSFINEYSENKVLTLYGISYFKEAEKIIETHRKNIAKYFPSSNSSVKAYVGDVLKSLSDVEQLYSDIQKLDKIINLSKINHISKLSSEVSDLIDVLIEQNTKSGILLKNNSTKKELINAIYTVAKEVELVSYIYSNCMFFYSAIKSLSDVIIKVGKTK